MGQQQRNTHIQWNVRNTQLKNQKLNMNVVQMKLRGHYFESGTTPSIRSLRIQSLESL